MSRLIYSNTWLGDVGTVNIHIINVKARVVKNSRAGQTRRALLNVIFFSRAGNSREKDRSRPIKIATDIRS